MMNEAQATTFCWVWRVTPISGSALGFTDHDKDLMIDGLRYRAESGFAAHDIDSKIGFAADNSEVQAILTDATLNAADIDAGIYDGAEVLIRRANWADSETFEEIWRGHIGKISRNGNQFTAELLGLTARLSRSTGRVFSKHCDAEFCDIRCGLKAENFAPGTQCPRTFAACRDQFSNTRNFRGFPYLIGDDAMQAAADSAAIRSGGSRYGHLL